jgi:FkbM family methyltransferase
MQEMLRKRLVEKERKLTSRIPWKGGIFQPTDKFPLEERVRGLERVLRILENDWPKKYRQELRRLRDKYSNRSRCFIIGNGPSLNETNLDLLVDEATFGVNGIFLKFPETKFRPTFYVVDDHLVAEDWGNEINDMTGPFKLFPIYLAYCLHEGPNTIFFNHRPRPSYPHGFDFSTDASKATYTGCTVTFTCMQLAFYLGFKEIYLVGVDHNYQIPKDVEQQNTYGTQILNMSSYDPNHFHPEYFGRGRRWHEPMVQKMEEAYKEALKVTRSKGVNIRNATIAGKLEIFPRVDYYSLFSSSSKTIYPSAVTRDESGESGKSASQTYEATSSKRGLSTTTGISIVVPIYNVERPLLEACLNSLVKQTLHREEYEIVLADDCSTKGDTLSVINQFTKGTTNTKLVRHTENLGPNEARRSGVRAAVGDYVLFVDSDDMLTRDALENLGMKAQETAADLVTAPAFRWSDKTKSYDVLPSRASPLPSDYVARLKAVFAEQSLAVWGRLYKRDILTDAIFDLPPHLVHEDLSTFARILFKARNVANINRPVYYYMINEAGLTYRFVSDHVDGTFYAFNDWIESAASHGLLEELSSAISYGIERFVSILVIRCVLCETLNSDDKVKILNAINEKYRALPLRQRNAVSPGLELLERLHADGIARRPPRLQEAIKTSFPAGIPAQPNIETRLKRSLVPTGIARRLKDKVVFVCQGDYQLRPAALFARELRLRGHPSVVFDNSAFASGGLRQLPSKENKIFLGTERIRVTRPPYDPDWLSTAKLVILFDDFSDDFREALEYRHRLGLPSVCMVAGIDDFLRVDFEDYRHLPYRRCDYVFLAGSDDKKYFEDRQTYVTGLPVIESLATKVPAFPGAFLAVLNVNFACDAPQEARKEFIVKAKKAFATCGYEWVINKHPMDRAGLRGYPVSKLTQYELIDRCSVFVSRFAAGILEALASGKPAIYFNPHSEKVEKFKSSLGAYEIATTEEELVQALQNVANDIQAGVDFRQRALPFLELHAGYRPDGPAAAQRFADAVAEILECDCGRQSAVSNLFFERLYEQEPSQCEGSGSIVGDFERRHGAQLPEEEVVARYFGSRGSIMIDVGATYGHGLAIYLGRGWTIHAFEPDSSNRRSLSDAYPSCSRLTISEEAVYDKAGLTVPLFRSGESAGISGLSAFTARRRQVGEVKTTTLRDYYRKAGLRHVDFLRIGTKGFGRFILDGFPWESDRPEVILVKFEDAKMTALGYSAHELADRLIRGGYVVYVSEWLPIVRHGITHTWRRLVRYSPALELDTTWGNMIGFLEDPGEDKLRALAQKTLKFAARRGRENVATATPQFWSASGTWYLHIRDRLAEYVMRRHPRLARMYRRMRHKGAVDYLKTHYPMITTIGRFARWVLTALKSTLFGIGGIAVIIVVGLYVAGALIEPVRWYLVGIASALLLLCGGLLALSYVRSILDRFIANQHQTIRDQSIRQSTQLKVSLDGLRADLNKELNEREKQARWRTIKDLCRGRRAFIIGNGPSLNRTPLHLLNNESTMCFNRFDLMFERISWRPTMYMCVDDRVAEDTAPRINEIIPLVRFAFFPDIHPIQRGMDFRHFIADAHNIFWLSLKGYGFYENLPTCGLGGTVAYTALQVLAFMGFSQIHLVGVDMEFKDHETAIKHDERNWTATQDDDPNHFDPRYFGTGAKYHYPRLHENMLPWLERAKEQLDAKGVKVLNAGIGGSLEIFPRVDFRSLFDIEEEIELEMLLSAVPPDLRPQARDGLQGDRVIEVAADWDEQGPVQVTTLQLAEQLIPRVIFTHIPYGPFGNRYLFVRREKGV